ncbi:MAG: protoheme IX farnesyltransferase [Bacteroidales bacterium]|nr:protoheme IX farnesyltransferase [Bacteroidales bacterium]
MTNSRTSNLFSVMLELSKVKITFAVAFTTITGYVLASGKFNLGLIVPTLGIFILACGSSVINHIMESKTDALMERTKLRPIPSGRISRTGAVIIAILEIVAGTVLLYFGAGLIALILGLLALIWYNIVYTLLKRITPNAVIPGSVIGSIPPLVGWIAGGGTLSDYHAWIIALFFFLWQVPHFYLLILLFGKEYKRAGFPTLTDKYSDKKIKNLILVWILATILSLLLFPIFGLTQSIISLIGIVIISVWIIIIFLYPAINNNVQFSPRKYFMRINYFVLIALILMLSDHFF